MTHKLADVERARAWRDAAVADGWSIEGTYEPGESVDRASRLKREGFVAQIITRTPIEGDRHATYFNGEVHVWGPDSLAVRPGATYDWDKLVAGLRTCMHCRKTDVETQRYSFAGRCCEACLPAMRAAAEGPGWCD